LDQSAITKKRKSAPLRDVPREREDDSFVFAKIAERDVAGATK
jgi:hypothetical protein